jgi:hypothetical protein
LADAVDRQKVVKIRDGTDLLAVKKDLFRRDRADILDLLKFLAGRRVDPQRKDRPGDGRFFG